MRMLLFLALVSIGFASTPLAAQGRGGGAAGVSLTPSIECTYLYAHDQADRHWLRALILWREPPPGRTEAPATEEQLREARHAFRQLQEAAEDSERTFAGGYHHGIAYGVSWDPVTLWVAGEHYALPADDSALVVVVDLPDAPGRPMRVLTTTFVPASLPADFWPQTMHRGDTLLTFHSRYERIADLLLSHLRANAVLRDLLQ